MSQRSNIKGRVLAIQKAQRREVGCVVTGDRVLFGHNVPKSNQKTKRIWKQNISRKMICSNTLGNLSLKISRRGERTIIKYGGLDNFLMNCKKRKLTLKAQKLKRLVCNRIGA